LINPAYLVRFGVKFVDMFGAMKDETWAELSTLDMSMRVYHAHLSQKQNCLA